MWGCACSARCVCFVNRWRCTNKRKCYCIVATICIVGIVFILGAFEFSGHMNMKKVSCLDARFESGEAALMEEILNWMNAWLAQNGVSNGEAKPGLNPCVKHSAHHCRDVECIQPLQWDIQDRIHNEMFDTDMMLTMQQIIRLQCFGDQLPVHDVIMATGASSNQFEDLQIWLRHANRFVVPEMRQRDKRFLLAVVDMGLKHEQRVLISKTCDCTVVTFPSWSFPDHVNKGDNCTSWRPVVIRAFLPRARHSLIYTDPNVLLDGGQIWRLLGRVETTNVLFSSPLPNAFPVHTAKETFDYFKVDACAFYPFPEIQSDFGIFRNTSLVSRVLLEPWTSCALTKDCVCPELPKASCPEPPRILSVGQCHKFDQSVLNILLAKIFRYNINHVTLPPGQGHIRKVTREDTSATNGFINPAIASGKTKDVKNSADKKRR